MTTYSDDVLSVARAVASNGDVFMIASETARMKLVRLIQLVPDAKLDALPGHHACEIEVFSRSIDVRVFPRHLFTLEQVERIYVPETAPPESFDVLRTTDKSVVILDPDLTKGEVLVAKGYAEILYDIGRAG